MKTTALLLGMLLLSISLDAQTWRTAGLVGNVLALPPGNCSSTWYDPEVVVYPDGNRGFLAQGGMANSCYSGDSIFRAKHNSSTLSWELPAANSCPTLIGQYVTTNCGGQLSSVQPLASPAIAKVGNKY